ncbi:unnamed protein product, partial [Notodromas monacha]
EKVKPVGYNEKLDVFGALQVSAVSSGYCIGSCNWIISSYKEKIVFMSGSSTLTTHPMSCDQVGLRNADALIVTGLTQTPSVNPDTMIGEFCTSVVATLKAGGNVLVPCYPSGVIYDLFECVSGHLDTTGLSGVPLYFISPVADSSLAYSNIFAEWLSTGKQNRVYLPDEPFPHANLVREGRLKSFRYVHDEKLIEDYREPCIVFCGHPSLRFGAAVHFTLLWGSNPANAIVFTESDFDHAEALSPYQPLRAKVTFCPIDTCVNFTQCNLLIKDLKPATIVVPQKYTVPPPNMPQRSDLKLDIAPSTNVITFRPMEVVEIPLERTVERIEVDLELAKSLVPVELRPGLKLALVPQAELHRWDNKFTLKPHAQISDSPASPEEESGEGSKTQKSRKCPTQAETAAFMPCGKLDINGFVRHIQDVFGAQNVKVGYEKDTVILLTQKSRKCPTQAETAAFMPCGKLDINGFVRHIQDVFGAQNVKVGYEKDTVILLNVNEQESVIRLAEGNTHICSTDETLRRKLCKLVIEKLSAPF